MGGGGCGDGELVLGYGGCQGCPGIWEAVDAATGSCVSGYMGYLVSWDAWTSSGAGRYSNGELGTGVQGVLEVPRGSGHPQDPVGAATGSWASGCRVSQGAQAPLLL